MLQIRKSNSVLLEDADLAQACSNRPADQVIGSFGDAALINPSFFEAACYVARDEEAKHDVFLVLHEAMRKSGAMALSRVVIAPSGKGLICYTQHDPPIGLI